MVRRIGRDSVFIALNGSGATVPAFKAVYVIAGAGDVPSVGLAKSNDLDTMPAVGISLQSIENGAYGRIMQVGLIENINWSVTPEGSPIYVSPTTAGDYTVTAPVFPNYAQEIGNCFITGAAGQMQVRMGALQTIPLDQRYVTIDTISNPTAPAINTLWDYSASTGFTGRVTGGTISNCTATPDSWITVAAGAGFIRADTSTTSELYSFEWAALDLQLTSAENDVYYIYVDYNSGSPIVKHTTDRTIIDFTSQFTLGRAYYYSAHTPKQRLINSGTNVWNLASRIHERELSTEGFAWADGAVTTQPANLKLQTTTGHYYLGINPVTTTAKNTNASPTPDTFIVWYRSATPGLWKEVAPATTLIANQWDDNSGTINTTVTTNRYTIQWIYILYDGSLNIVLGHKYGDTTTCTYTLAEAEAAQAPETPPLISKFGALVAKAIIFKGGTSIYELQETRMSYSTGAAADHANLSSLDYASANHTGFAPIASPTFTGIPAADTAALDVSTTQLATTAFVQNQRKEQPTSLARIPTNGNPSKGGVFNGGFELAPTFVAVQTASNWIDGTAAGSATTDQYGWWVSTVTGTVAVRYDPTITHSGKYSLKISLVDTSGTTYVINGTPGNDVQTITKYYPLLKASTKYRLSMWIKTNNVAADSVYFSSRQFDTSANLGTLSTSTKLTGTNDWTHVKIDFSSDSAVGGSYLRILMWNTVDGNISDAWFDDITLEEVVEDTTFTGTIPTPVRPTIVGVTTTDNIDVSKTGTTGDSITAYEYWAAQQFQPTKNKITQVSFALKKVGSPTGSYTVSIETDNANAPSGVVLASTSIDASILTTGYITYTFNVPCLWTTGKLWVTEKGQAGWDGANYVAYKYTSGAFTDYIAYGVGSWSTTSQSFQYEITTYYAKPTENATIVCNGEKISLSTNEDGLLSGAIIDLDKGKYLYSQVNPVNLPNDVYSASVGGGTINPQYINGWLISSGFLSAPDATARNIIFKINTMLSIKNIQITSQIRDGSSFVPTLLQYSLDGVNWTTLQTCQLIADANTTYVMNVPVSGVSTIYYQISKTGNGYMAQLMGLKIYADLDTASVPSLILQPLATPVQYSENIVLPATGASVYYWTAKYANDRGVVVPHLEIQGVSPYPVLKAIPLKVDNSGETNPAIKILNSESTTCTVGSGTDEGGNFILNNGEYVTVTTPATSLKITYQVGKGTTAFTNLTMNRIYLSSNGVANSATKDPSHQFNFYLGMLKEGVQKVVEKLQTTVNDISNAIHREYGEMVASGTAFTLTTAFSAVTFGTTGALAINLPEIGIYEVSLFSHEDFISATAIAGATNNTIYTLYIDGVALTNGSRIGIGVGATFPNLRACNASNSWIVKSTRPGTLVSVYAMYVQAITGTWNINSDSNGYTTLRYKRIA